MPGVAELFGHLKQNRILFELPGPTLLVLPMLQLILSLFCLLAFAYTGLFPWKHLFLEAISFMEIIWASVLLTTTQERVIPLSPLRFSVWRHKWDYRHHIQSQSVICGYESHPAA